MENVGIIMAICCILGPFGMYILWPFGMYILWSFSVYYGHLVYFMAI
jgi:hypothetical protein